ncbi:hypothetical protein [Gallaecimonas sp. GXIMD4217]|uniref:hypothetical protein n=1 Tax=Gallaecimonas sp. GXIMD4217 TaxID=3131927 RepID=UPI00311AD134
MRALLKLLLVISLSSALTASLIFSAFYLTFQQLQAQEPVARVHFRPLSPQLYQAELSLVGQCQTISLPLRGDDFRLDARFITWPAWAVWLGLEPRYRIERLAGRYRDIDQANSRPHKAHDLRPQTWMQDDWLDGLGWLVDSDYGSSTYAPMDSRQDYVVYRSQTGLLLKSVPARPDPEQLTLTADSPCLTPQSYWQQAAQWLDRWLRQRQQA